MRRTDQQIVLFAKGGLLTFAIDLGTGGEEEGHLALGARFEQDFSFPEIVLEDANGGFDDEVNADTRCQMIDCLGVGEEARQVGTG